MLNALFINGTEDTPKILLDQQNGVFEIAGCSFPEDGSKFYAPVLSWIEEYVKDPRDETQFYFNLDYFNSTSVKQLLEILIRLEAITPTEKKVKIIWSYDKDDELIAAKGQEIQEMVSLPFELKLRE